MGYKCEDEFIIRVPYISINKYTFFESDLFIDNDMNKFIHMYFKENLKVLSTELYENFKKNFDKKVKMSCLKYLIRSTTRCTPYGLAAGIIIGNFADTNNLCIKQPFLKKARPDMEWLVKVIKICEKELDLNLMICNNNACEKEGFLLVKKWNSCFIDNEDSKSKDIHINYTPAVNHILEICKNPISKKDLLYKLKLFYPNKNDDFLINFINTLLNKEFLISNLRVGNNEESQLNRLIEKLKVYSSSVTIYDKLLEIQDLFNKYNNLRIGESLDLYDNLISKMSKITKTKNYIQIDMYSKEQLNLENKLKNQIEDYANFLSSISNKERKLEEFILKFEEKYGNQLIKLKDIIEDKDFLLISKKNDNSIKYFQNINSILISILYQQKTSSIDLSQYEKNIELYFGERDNDYHELDLAFYLVKDNLNYEFITSPLVGTNSNNKIMGRFNYLFDKKNIVNNEIDFSFIPYEARHYNVIMSVNKNSKFVNYGSFNERNPNQIDYDDIYLGIRNNKIVFFDKKTKKQINFSSSNMFVDQGYPKAFQFILTINNMQNFNAFDFYQSLIKIVMGTCCVEFPEIRYKSFIILPRTWKLDSRFIINNKLIAKQSFLDNFKEFKEQYKIPNHISVGPGDNRLLLNITNRYHLEILWDIFSKDYKLLMYEPLYQENNTVISSSSNEKYLGEFVFSLKNDNKVKAYVENNDKLFIDSNIITNTSSHFFDEWIYLKIYTKDVLMTKILVYYIQKLFNELISSQIAKEMFFIRYQDPNDHIRLRIKYDKNNLMYILDKLKVLMDELIEKNYINDYKFDTYVPETNRYGGENCIQLAERLFCIDSLSVLNLLDSFTNKLVDYSLEQIYIISAYIILKHFNISDDDIMYMLAQFTFGKKGTSEYNKFKFIEDIVEDNTILTETEQNIRLQINFEMRKKEFMDYGNLIFKEFGTDLDAKKEIVLSVLHMHFNRMIGINRNLEFKMNSYLRKILYRVFTRRKYNHE